MCHCLFLSRNFFQILNTTNQTVSMAWGTDFKFQLISVRFSIKNTYLKDAFHNCKWKVQLYLENLCGKILSNRLIYITRVTFKLGLINWAQPISEDRFQSSSSIMEHLHQERIQKEKCSDSIEQWFYNT